MTATTYNGWTNYETWAAALWLDNDAGAYEHWRDTARSLLEQSLSDYPDDADRARADAAGALAQAMRDDLEDNAPDLGASIYADLLTAALGAIDWREIADHWVDEIDIYCAGWNMPGYLPDNPPALFTDPDAAMEYIQDAAMDENDADTENAEDTVHERRLAIDAWRADSNGEFGQTVGRFHYFVRRV